MPINSNYDILNVGAEQIWSSAVHRYNIVPNPQLAADALQVGAGTDVAAALGNSDPNSDSALASSGLAGPLGSSDGSFSKPRADANASAQSGWNYDRNQYRQSQADALAQNGGLHDTFADINGIPIANVQYANDTLYWVNKDSKQAKNWQQHLIDSGVYQDSALFGDTGRRQADGRWTAADEQALYLYLARIGEPDAMHSKNVSHQQNAATAVNYFYNQVGIDWTADGMRRSIGNNDQMRREYQDGLFQNWLSGHPYKKEDGGALQDRLNEYLDLYGSDALPADVASLGSGGNFLTNILTIPGDLVGGITGLADMALRKTDENAKKDAADIESGGLSGGFLGYIATPAAKALVLQAKLTANEQNALAPVINKVAAGSDFATQFGSWWGHQVTKLQLTPLYAVGDLFSGKDHSINPFDPLARAWSGATAHEDNFMAGLVGKDWVDQHTAFATAINFGAGFLDPTVFVGLAGRALSFGQLTRSIEAGSALSKADLIKNGVPLTAMDKLRYVMFPRDGINRIADAAMPSLLRGAQSAYDRAVLLGVGADVEGRERVMKLLHDESGAFKSSLTDQEILDFVLNRDNMLGHSIFSSASGWYNFRQSLSMMNANILRRLDRGKLLRAWEQGTWGFGHQTLNFEEDFRTSVEKMQHEAALFGMPSESIGKYITQIMLDPTAAVDVATKFYEELMALIPQEVADRLAEMRKSVWDGKVPDSVRHKYAVDPRGPTSPTGTAEISTAPIKVPSHLQAAYDAHQLMTKAAEVDLMNKVEIYQKGLGFQMAGSAEANAPIVDRFLADPANKAYADNYMAQKQQAEQALKDLLGSSETERGVPMIEAQLAKIFHAPFSTWELILATHSKLGDLEKIQRKLRLDAMMNFWKLYTLAKPSSAMRALVGDDSLRVAVQLAFAGSAKAAARQVAGQAMMKRIARAPIQFPLMLLTPVAKGVFGMGDHVREAAFTFLRQKYGMSKEDAVKASKGWYAAQIEYLGALAPDMRRLAEMSDHTGGFHSIGPDMPGHTEAMGWWIRSIGAGPGRDWARIFNAQGEDAAREYLVNARLKGLSPENIRLQAAKGASKADIKTMQDADRHAQHATQFQAELDAMDATMPRYTRGPNKGKPKFAGRQYQQMYAAMKKKIPAGMQPGGFTGSYRDRVVALIKHHTDMSNDFPQIVMEQARNEHDFYKRFAAIPELRDMVAAGQVDEKVLKKLTKNGVTRPMLPWVVANEDTPHTKSFVNKVMEAPAQASMDHIFTPIIVAGRAEAMSYVHNWWREYLTEFYKDAPSVTPDRIERAALGQAQDWMRHNTYQGARSIGSYALRNAVPFSGSVMNQDNFWLQQFKAHPWAAGVAAKLGIDIDQHREDRRVTLPNPLGWAHIGGDTMSINPLGFTFIGSEGMGSTVAGLGPFTMPFAAIAQQNSYVKQVFDMIPGWSEHTPKDATVASAVSGMVPSYLRKPTEAAGLMAGLPAGMVPGAEKDIADRTRLDEAEGRRPTEDEVRHEVAVGGWEQGAASWLLPLQPRIGNQTEDLIKKAAGQEAQGQTIADLRKDPAFQAIAPYLEYRDNATSPQRKDQIAHEYPQVLAWAAPITETKGTSGTPKTFSFHDWKDLKAQGGEHFLSAGEIDREIQQAYQTNQFFQAYDVAYAKLRDQFLSDNDVAQSSRAYKDFKATTLDPIMDQLKLHYPLGYDKFIGNSKSLNDEGFTNAIGSLNSFFHMPTTAEFDSKGVNNWRVVSDLVQQTVTNIVEAKNSGSSAVELQAISQQFHDAINERFGSDPAFLDEIGFRYHWSSWVDFLTTNANDEIKREAG